MRISRVRTRTRRALHRWYARRPPDSRGRRAVRRLERRLAALERSSTPWFDLRTNGEWALLHTLSRRGRPVETIVDVGANTGEWYRAARRAFPAARIVLVEIAPPLWPRLDALVADDPHAQIMHYGLGAEDGDVTLRFFPHAPALSTTLPFPHRGLPDELRAPVRSVEAFLDDAGLDRVDVVKVDVEGGEFPVVLGLEPLLAAGHIGILQFEYGQANILSHALLYDYAAVADRTGCVLGRLHPGGIDFAPYTFLHEDFRPRNMVLCRADLVDHVQQFDGLAQG